MRAISNSLLAAQQSPASTPYCKVELRHRIASATRLDWELLYEGSESDNHHAATIPGDGSLNRLRVAGSTLYRQRVTSPRPGSDFSSWTDTGYSDPGAIACCSHGSEVLLFALSAYAHLPFYRCESADYGATWGAWINTGLYSDVNGRIAATQKHNGDVCLLYTRGATLYSCKRETGVWGAETAWTNTLGSISGIALIHSGTSSSAGDWNVVVAGVDTDNRKGLWSCVFGDGYWLAPGQWSSLKDIMLAESDSDISYKFPFLDLTDVYRLFFVEEYSGTQSYTRPYWSYSLPTSEYIDSLWREPIPFNFPCSYGLALTCSAPAPGGPPGRVWLTHPSRVWRAPLHPYDINLTQDVLSLRQEIVGAPSRGRLDVELENSQGQYASFDMLGCELLVSPGYFSTRGTECSSGPSFWIEGWEYQSRRGRSSLVLCAIDTCGLLENWKARRQYQWAAGDKTIFQLLEFIFARAGLALRGSLIFGTSWLLVNHMPAFAIYPGQSGLAAVRRLLDMVPDVLLSHADQTYTIFPQVDDDVNYSYGTTHPVIEGRYRTMSWETNRSQVFGSSLMLEKFDWTEIEDVYDRLSQVHDVNIALLDTAQYRSEAELRKAEIQATRGYISVPVNCGQELWDVVEITDARVGLTSQKRRVVGLTYTFIPAKAQYRLNIDLGAV